MLGSANSSRILFVTISVTPYTQSDNIIINTNNIRPNLLFVKSFTEKIPFICLWPIAGNSFVYYTFTSEFCHHLQLVDADLLRVIVLPRANDTQPV